MKERGSPILRIYHSRLRQFLINFRYQKQNLPRVYQYASRIPKMYCMKSKQIWHGRAVLGSMANFGWFVKIGQNRQCKLAQTFNTRFSTISWDTFLESLKHVNQPWVGFVAWTWNFIKNSLSLLLCCANFFEVRLVVKRLLYKTY